jgi:hypothetical protein
MHAERSIGRRNDRPAGACLRGQRKLSVLTTLMFHWGILPPVVRGFAVALEKTLGVGGAVGAQIGACGRSLAHEPRASAS